jgi:bacterioferritin (cytochrome b1)
MTPGDEAIIENLQTGCQILSHLAEQYRVDARQLHAMGVGWLQDRIHCFYQKSERFLDKFIDRLLYFDTDPEYDAGKVTGADSITDILERDGALVYAALEQFWGFRKHAWDVQPDATTDLYEHAIQMLEKQAYKIERELGLIKEVGGEGSYIAARLEDG